MYRLYVTTNGCDGNDGSREKPFATIERARDAVREKIAAGLHEPVTVTVAAGEYKTAGIRFTPEDSGTEDCPVTYEAEGKVILNGGLTLTDADFTGLTEAEKSRLHGDARENVVKTDLTKYGLTRADWGEISAIGAYHTAKKYDGAVVSPMWCELFVNDRRMEIARYPDSGYLYTEEVIREGNCLEPTGKERLSAEEWAKIRNPLGDVRRIDRDTARRVQNWQTLENVWVFGYPRFNWADDSTPVAAVDTEACTMETKYVSMYGTRERAPYYFFNVLEELDQPGEWYLDRENGILYLYPPVELEGADICLSIGTGNLIRAEGADWLTFRGFTVLATRGDAVWASGNGITIEDCEIKNIAGWAVRVYGNRCTVKNCRIHHIGQGGIWMEGGDRATLTSSGNLVTNNHIHHLAEIFRTYRPGVEVHGVNCVVSHNCIHDSAHMAIQFLGNEHVIEYNEICNVCLFADDSAAIYSGRDYTTCGNVIRYNYFHDMSSTADAQHIGIFAVYCDDNLGSCEIYGNVMLRCQSALLLHGGHDIRFANNLIIDECPRSNYALRVHAYGGWKDLVDQPGSTHWGRLRQVPWESDLWKEKYPHIGQYLTWDPEKEQRCPHFCTIENNAIINHKPINVERFNYLEPKYGNVMRNNAELPDRSFAGIPEGETPDLRGCRLHEIIPGFCEIPFDKMGLLKE